MIIKFYVHSRIKDLMKLFLLILFPSCLIQSEDVKIQNLILLFILLDLLRILFRLGFGLWELCKLFSHRLLIVLLFFSWRTLDGAPFSDLNIKLLIQETFLNSYTVRRWWRRLVFSFSTISWEFIFEFNICASLNP